MPMERFKNLIERIDQLNRQDPHVEVVEGTPQPWELLYSQWLSDWVLRLDPDASEALRIAARGQHLRRWTIPRRRYPMTRRGYLQWREALKAFHIQEVTALMGALGYPDQTQERVQRIMSKRHLQEDPESQTLEDALCLVFLEQQFEELRRKTPQEKMADILRKTWLKMSPRARAEALKLPLTDEGRQAVQAAVSPGP